MSLIIIIIIIIITRFQSEDQVCISTTLRELDKSVLAQTCRCESQSSLSIECFTPSAVETRAS
jgi:hypothetical protein